MQNCPTCNEYKKNVLSNTLILYGIIADLCEVQVNAQWKWCKQNHKEIKHNLENEFTDNKKSHNKRNHDFMHSDRRP